MIGNAACLRNCMPFLGLVVSLAVADEGTSTAGRHPQQVRLEQLRTLHVTTAGQILEDSTIPLGDGGGERGCQQVSTWTAANFAGGDFVVQAGFSERELAAASYTIDTSLFPIRIDLMEMVFATGGTSVMTTTEWSVLVWEGTPDTGNLVAEFSSDGVILPHIVLPPGPPAGVNVQVSIDPNDPEQIIVSNSGGSNTFSFGYRIDHHNSQTANPCFISPPADFNAFPTTDINGLFRPANNWLWGLNCGPFGCPANGGWARFSSLPGFCRPSGDWVMRITWTPLSCTPGVGACCLNTGACDLLAVGDCQNLGGSYQGDGSSCGSVNCPAPMGACCFQATGGCLNLTSANCGAAGGVFGGNGTNCGSFVCFPQGACCLPNGSCLGPLSPTNCGNQGGVFQGNGTSCGSTNCPLPTAACCFATGFCLLLTEMDCGTAGGAWRGIGTNCSQPGFCSLPSCGACADSNCDGAVSVGDIGYFVAAMTTGQGGWNSLFPGEQPPCDFVCANDANNDNNVTVSDIGQFVARLINGIPCGG